MSLMGYDTGCFGGVELIFNAKLHYSFGRNDTRFLLVFDLSGIQESYAGN